MNRTTMAETTPLLLSTLLRERRERRDCSQREAAEKIGVTLRSYQKYESGEIQTPHPRHRKRIARFLDMPWRAFEQILVGVHIQEADREILREIRELANRLGQRR